MFCLEINNLLEYHKNKILFFYFYYNNASQLWYYWFYDSSKYKCIKCEMVFTYFF